MDGLEPDETVIEQYESYLKGRGALDELSTDLSKKTVGELIEVCRGDGNTTLTTYLEIHFNPDTMLCDHHLTGREEMAAIREGSPAGVFYYLMAKLYCAGCE